MDNQLFREWVYVGGTKGEARVSAMLQVLHAFGVQGNEVTAYELARFCDLSPQHVNRILKKFYADGAVEFITFHRGNRVGRRWFAK